MPSSDRYVLGIKHEDVHIITTEGENIICNRKQKQLLEHRINIKKKDKLKY